ncbi:DinB family protein [Paenibacillus ginsengarvi]|uniref:DinB family protein n=1 Tax=Paenibacillus ginsengarvi TaxID=400777 RepID=A0A3B0CMZ8_9BACL|nr:DinB family protein [Paenibacillus ginsengarvi]RKN86251.1 DinB family protein [Paenibacillus ginsengarvi]
MSEIDIEAFLDTHGQLVRAVAGLTREELTWKMSPQSWSVTEVLNHLADHSIVVSFRLRDVLAGTTARLPSFEQDAWVSGQLANEAEVATILETFEQLLRYNGLLLRRLPASGLEKSGVNAKGDTVRIADIVESFTKHVYRHLEQIERVRRAYREAQPAV